jgi:hypothetical protein
MPSEETTGPQRHYQVDPKVVFEFRRSSSDYARASGASETDFHSFVFEHPELVTCYLGEEQSLAWRKELAFSAVGRVDLFVLFYGRSRCDLIECKGPKEPIIETHGTTKYLDQSLDQLAGYRYAFTHGLVSDSRFRIHTENQPRLVLIGDVKKQVCLSVSEQAAFIRKALSSNHEWKNDYDRGLLVVTTWDMLAEKAEKAGGVTTSRWCNNVVKAVLGSFTWDRNEQRTSLPSVDEFMVRASGAYDLQGTTKTLVEVRATAVIDKLKQLRVSPDKELDPQSLNSQLQLADWLLYEDNGDMPCGQWDHMSTYGARDILDNKPLLWTAIAGHLLNALAKDSSEDVLGRTSHILRYAPEYAKRLLLDDRTVRDRWRFPDPEAFAAEPLRPDLVNFTQVGYCLAHHGDPEAIVFMNQAAVTPHVVNDLAQWNTLHAKQNPEQLMQSLRQKVERPTENQKPFLPWHKAIFEATGYMFRRLERSQPS